MCLLSVAVVKNMHVFWTRGPQVKYSITANSSYISVCGNPTEEYAYFSKFIRPWIVFCLASALPACILLMCSLSILCKLCKTGRHSIMNKNKFKMLKQMTGMCLGVSLVFIICTIPSIIILIGRPWWSVSTPEAYTVAKGVNNLLVSVNHSINFFVYSVMGKKFRQVSYAMLFCKKNEETAHMFNRKSSRTSLRHFMNNNKHDNQEQKSLHE